MRLCQSGNVISSSSHQYLQAWGKGGKKIAEGDMLLVKRGTNPSILSAGAKKVKV